jgi:Cu+-exporting ATPase
MSAEIRHEHAIHHHARHDARGGAAPPGSDPMCGAPMEPDRTALSIEGAGVRYLFCSTGCRTIFEADPGRYLEPHRAGPGPAPPDGAIYACPMHPKIRQAGPGVCPICGLPLEPLMAGARGRAADATK